MIQWATGIWKVTYRNAKHLKLVIIIVNSLFWKRPLAIFASSRASQNPSWCRNMVCIELVGGSGAGWLLVMVLLCEPRTQYSCPPPPPPPLFFIHPCIGLKSNRTPFHPSQPSPPPLNLCTSTFFSPCPTPSVNLPSSPPYTNWWRGEHSRAGSQAGRQGRVRRWRRRIPYIPRLGGSSS